MRHRNRWLAALAVPIIVGLGLSACSQASVVPEASKSEPAHVEAIEGTELSRVTLSETAAERIGIQTDQVRDEQIGGTLRKVIPYAAVLYDPQGAAWTYTNAEQHLTFVRSPISVDRIEGDLAVLADGPPSGTEVVTVGAAELYGSEYGVGQ